MRKALSDIRSLMGAAFFVHGSNAAITTLIALVIAESGGEQSDVALVAACYSAGFIASCFLSTGQVFRVGIIRAFASAAAVLTISIVLLDLFYGVWIWAFLRFSMGACIAAILAITDSWINDKATNDQRGRVIAVYATLIGLASLLSQILFLIFDASAEGFVLIFAIATNIAVVLVAMTTNAAPELGNQARASQFRIVITSKTASVCAFSSGFMITAVVSVVPFYQTMHGVNEELVALTMVFLFLGRLLFMWPVGRLSDTLDRRSVLIGLSTAIATISLILIFAGTREGTVISGDEGVLMQGAGFLLTMLLGGALYPIYSVSSSLAFDRAGGKPMIDVSTSLLALNSLGAIAGPFVVSVLGNVVGDISLLLAILLASIACWVVAVTQRATVSESEEKTRLVAPTSETSVGMAQAAAELTEAEMENSDS